MPIDQPALMANAAGGLLAGKYQCYSFGGGILSYSFVDVNILGGSSYSDRNGKSGNYQANGAAIVFTSGPLLKHRAAIKDSSNFTLFAPDAQTGLSCSRKK